MQNPIEQLNKIFDSQLRLGIMSALMVHDTMTFNDLKATFDATDGNLATHLKKLEENNYVQVEKSFVFKKPQTTYKISKTGKKAFSEHVAALEKMIQQLK